MEREGVYKKVSCRKEQHSAGGDDSERKRDQREEGECEIVCDDGHVCRGNRKRMDDQ